jgi:hypothetical protein
MMNNISRFSAIALPRVVKVAEVTAASNAGSADECCPSLGAKPPSGKTCAAEFTDVKKPACDTALDAYCRAQEADVFYVNGEAQYRKDAKGNVIYRKPNMFTSSVCKNWVQSRLEAATTALESVCSNKKLPIYLDAARTKLGTNADIPECGCVVAKNEALKAGQKWPVECMDRRCTNQGIKTFPMTKTMCNIVDCSVVMSGAQFLGSNMDVSVQQNCSASASKTEEPASPDPSAKNSIIGAPENAQISQPVGGTVSDPGAATDRGLPVWVYIVVAIVVFVLIFAGAGGYLAIHAPM